MTVSRDGSERVDEQRLIKLTPKSGTVSGSGNNLLITPAASRRLRVYYFGYEPSAAVTCAFRFGVAGDLFLQYNIQVAYSIIMKDLGDRTKYVEGLPDESLYLNLSSGVSTLWNVFYEEIYP